MQALVEREGGDFKIAPWDYRYYAEKVRRAKFDLDKAGFDEALHRARDAVASFRIGGLKTNLPFHADLLDSEVFSSGDYDTSVISRLRP